MLMVYSFTRLSDAVLLLFRVRRSDNDFQHLPADFVSPATPAFLLRLISTVCNISWPSLSWLRQEKSPPTWRV